MKAIILAAGRGSRLCNLTDDRPKGLVSVGGRPLLEWQMEALRGAGISDITIVRGYRGDAIMYENVCYRDNPRWNETNMVGSLLAASDILASDDCVISYADIIYPAGVIEKLIAGSGDIRITYDTEWLELWNKRFENPLSDAETFRVDENGTLLEIGKKTRSIDEIQGQYMGLLQFTSAGWKLIADYLGGMEQEQIDRLDMTSLLQRLITANIHVDTVRSNDVWMEIDSKDDIELFASIWNRGRI